jgi:hypothetical protein
VDCRGVEESPRPGKAWKATRKNIKFYLKWRMTGFRAVFFLKIVGAPTLCTPNPNECDA